MHASAIPFSETLSSTRYIFQDGRVQDGPDLPYANCGHCMVTIDSGKVMIIGGDLQKRSKTVTLYDPNKYPFNPFIVFDSFLLYDRYRAGCAVYNSPMHDGRPVILIAGGDYQATAEVLDYTQTNASWTESKKLVYWSVPRTISEYIAYNRKCKTTLRMKILTNTNLILND